MTHRNSNSAIADINYNLASVLIPDGGPVPKLESTFSKEPHQVLPVANSDNPKLLPP